MKVCFDFIMTQPLVFLFQLIFGQWAALWESCWREKSSFLAPTVSFTSVARDLFFSSPSLSASTVHYGSKVPLRMQSSGGFASQSQGLFFLKGRCISTQKRSGQWKETATKGAELSGLSCSVSKCGEWTGFDLLIRVWRRDWKRAVDSFWFSQSPMQQHNKMR